MLLFGLSGVWMIGRISNNYADGGWGLLNDDAHNTSASESLRSTNNRTKMEQLRQKHNRLVVVNQAIIEQPQQQPPADASTTGEEIPSETELIGDGESPLVVDREYLQHLRSLDPFPTKLHILFPRKDYYKRRDVDFVKNGIVRFMELNPTWNVTVYDDLDMDGIIGMAADDGIISMDEMHTLVGTDTQPAAHRKILSQNVLVIYVNDVSKSCLV
jgi:hypothetical protein